MRKGKITLPDGTVCDVEERRWSGAKLVPKYKAPPPWVDTWFVVPVDRRAWIEWEGV